MTKLNRIQTTAILCLSAVALLAGCSSKPAVHVTTPVTPPAAESGKPATPPTTTAPDKDKPATGVNKATGEVVSNPADIQVLVNKRYMLPDGYVPADLVEPNVRFIFSEKHEKRLMRKEAAAALERMFAAAEKDGIHLAGVSGYRSYETQKSLFAYYVQTQGEELARRYSAEPGHSEHQTGLTMDISGSTGKCAADDCFAGTPEAEWLAAHGAEYGFIIRYPQGKEAITGYAYEPWHARYVGVDLAKQVADSGKTLEELLGKGN